MTTTEAPRTGSDSSAPRRRGFPDPYEIGSPEGAEGWRAMYPYYNQFLDARRAKDSQRTWFRNGMHFPEAMPPFDIVTSDSAFMSTGVMNTRVFALPPALGIDVRVLNGYVYMSANGVEDPEEIGRRAGEFAVRVGHYYQNWPTLYEAWERKIRAEIAKVGAIVIPEMGELEPVENVLAGRGVTTSNDLLVAYQALLASVDAAWNLHSEFLNMGYAAYLNFLMLCRSHFPEITDQSVAKMVSGVDVLLFRPDDELKKLAALAIELDLVTELTAGRPHEELRQDMSSSDAGARWWAAYDESADPWFHFSYGNGFYHHHRSWSDDPTFPLTMIGEYIGRLRNGEDLSRPVDAVAAERDAVTARYRGLIDDEADRQAFDEALGLSKVVFPYVENHNFFIEHWYMTTFWNKMRELGALFVRYGFFDQVDDLFFLRRAEIADALVDLQMAWCGGGEPLGPDFWPPVIAERRRVHAVLNRWAAPPALGPEPSGIVEPMTIMLWGITDEQVQKWLDAQDGGDGGRVLSGFAGSPGIAEGPARVVLSPSDLDELLEGEILVAPITSPSWTPVFARIKGAVSDIGGIMCHAAIVSREYGLPAVVGTGTGTTSIRTGQIVRVDGNTGTVTILSD
ncbi:PEP-utilizing protein mobile subunit [Blastococcus saxobsidens]|uniref:PEP-utilizing protein mobile subunit n=1 Tax=Blastococcus saxobsidens TaxID=138336 RepID=A0A6L9W488_9ACTN|nr:PEP-utilizing enzyme [Blastococcus saxobsidens]NEK86875.1 PEP-utilizing protein mobile subunit [Blastococcus saxobsidens]